jgi:hypothetical protein
MARAAGQPNGAEFGDLQAPPSVETRLFIRRFAIKDRIIRELLAGDITLLEAAAGFRFVNDHPPECPCLFRTMVSGDSDGEKACRHVILWVRSHLLAAGATTRAEAVLGRLEAELRTLLASGDGIELPW